MTRQTVKLDSTSIKPLKRMVLTKKLFVLLALYTGIAVFLSIFTMFGPHKYQTSIFFFVLLLMAIAAFFILSKKLVLFEPVVLFSAYYVTVVIAGFYSIFTDWRTNIFINNTSFYGDITSLTNYTSGYFFIGYIATLAGYYWIKKNNLAIQFRLDSKGKISDKVLNIFIVTFLIIGIVNFVYNLWFFANGNIFTYMADVSIRHLQFSDQGTTLGYILAYNAMYFWFFKLLREEGGFQNKKFIFFLIITVLMKASTGRIFGTMVYISTFIGIYYFLDISNKKVVNNAKYYLIAAIMMVFGVIFYFMRIISSLSYNKMLQTSIETTFLELFNQFGYYAIDMGNMPNLGVVAKIIDSWGTDIGYLYGQSLFTWVFDILPSSIRPTGYQPAVMIKQEWYSHIQGGNVPATGIGEMYANFGVLGPILGMFLFGCLMAFLYNYTIKSKSYWVLAIYVQIAIGFIMLYPKGEFNNLSLWFIVPILFMVAAVRIISGSAKGLKNSHPT